jgi:hypothetical protein
VDADGAADESINSWTVKSCGPDATTLASSLREATRKRWWQTSPVTRESTKEPVKTIVQGRPGDLGVLAVTTLVCFFIFTHEAAGASQAPGFPCALCFLEGRRYKHAPGANASRERTRHART